jgi:hypothetical protein
MYTLALDPGLSTDYTHRNNWEIEFITKAKQQLSLQYQDYMRQYGRPTNESPESPTIDDDEIPRVLQHAYGRRITNRNQQENELDSYHQLSRDLLHVTSDVLAWWKSNQETFPILARMAKDFLAVPGKKKSQSNQRKQKLTLFFFRYKCAGGAGVLKRQTYDSPVALFSETRHHSRMHA